MIFETWNPDIQESWNPPDLAGFSWLLCIGYISVFVTERYFQCKIQKFYHLEFWNSFCKLPIFYHIQQIGCFPIQFLALIRFSTLAYKQRENFESLALTCFCQFQSIGYYSCLVFILVHNLNVSIQISIISGIFFELSGTLEFLQKWLVLTLIRVGVPPGTPCRYLSAISKRSEIMSCPLVTFNFKTFQKHRTT